MLVIMYYVLQHSRSGIKYYPHIGIIAMGIAAVRFGKSWTRATITDDPFLYL